MFGTVPLSIIRSPFTVHSAMVYVIQVCRQLSSRTRMELQFHPGPARKLSTNLYDIYHSWVYSEWTPNDGQRHCPKHVEFHAKNKFEKLVHLVGLIVKKFVTMHGQMNVKYLLQIWRFLRTCNVSISGLLSRTFYGTMLTRVCNWFRLMFCFSYST